MTQERTEIAVEISRGVDWHLSRESKSTECVTCCECGEARSADDCEFVGGGWICICCKGIRQKPDEDHTLAEVWRNHLDEGDPEDDNEWESCARQILWNGADTKALKEIGGVE